ncbi:MAG: hypothetical protein AB1468_03685 [Candidatus Micrarchaeota archaeon]
MGVGGSKQKTSSKGSKLTPEEMLRALDPRKYGDPMVQELAAMIATDVYGDAKRLECLEELKTRGLGLFEKAKAHLEAAKVAFANGEPSKVSREYRDAVETFAYLANKCSDAGYDDLADKLRSMAIQTGL